MTNFDYGSSLIICPTKHFYELWCVIAELWNRYTQPKWNLLWWMMLNTIVLFLLWHVEVLKWKEKRSVKHLCWGAETCVLITTWYSSHYYTIQISGVKICCKLSHSLGHNTISCSYVNECKQRIIISHYYLIMWYLFHYITFTFLSNLHWMPTTQYRKYI